jgi:hypothetical protein
VYTEFWWGNLKERDHFEYLGVDVKITLEWIFKKWDGWYGLDWSRLGQGQVAGAYECGNELSVS